MHAQASPLWAGRVEQTSLRVGCSFCSPQLIASRPLLARTGPNHCDCPAKGEANHAHLLKAPPSRGGGGGGSMQIDPLNIKVSRILRSKLGERELKQMLWFSVTTADDDS